MPIPFPTSVPRRAECTRVLADGLSQTAARPQPWPPKEQVPTANHLAAHRSTRNSEDGRGLRQPHGLFSAARARSESHLPSDHGLLVGRSPAILVATGFVRI